MSENVTQRFYDRISHVYDLIADSGERAARERGLEMLHVQNGESVLEIGFGTGHSLQTIAEAVGEEGNVAGIDISPKMRDIAQKRLEDAAMASRFNLVVGAVPPIPFESDLFDVIDMSFTLELFPIEIIPEVLKECRRVLKPGGRIGIVSMATVENGENASVLERTYVWMHSHFPHIVDCQPIAVESLVENAGFKIEQSERFDLFTMPVAILTAS